MRDLAAGASCLARGFGMWRRRPGLMVLGMVPALVVFVVLAGLFVALCVEVGPLVRLMTPFADDWSPTPRVLVRVLLAVALLVGALVLASSVFAGLTLAVGDPFYEHVWRQTEAMLGGPEPGEGPGFVSAIGDGLVLALSGLAVAVGLFVVGFLPVVGTAAGTVVGLVASGRLLADELLTRPLEARGLDRRARETLLRSRRTRVAGFGVATQACFLVPLGAVVAMPAAVVGSTLLARELLGLPADLDAAS